MTDTTHPPGRGCHPSPSLRRPASWVFFLVLLTLVGAATLAGSPRTANAATPSDDALCAQALAMLNAERIAVGLPAIEATPTIIAVAVERARDMAETGYFSHVSPSGADAYSLLINQGIDFRRMGENIAQSTDPAPVVVAGVHAMLMASAPHRANMLDPTYGQVGIGIVRTGNTYYFAIVFAG